MNVNQFVRVAKLYCQEGSSLMDQFDSLLMGEMEDCNPNAVKCMKRILELLVACDVEDAESDLDTVNEWLSERKIP